MVSLTRSLAHSLKKPPPHLLSQRHLKYMIPCSYNTAYAYLVTVFLCFAYRRNCFQLLASRIPIRLLRRRFNFGNQMPPEERWRVCSDSEKWKDKAALANSTTLTGTSVTSWRPSRNGFFVLFLHRLSRPSRVGNKSPIEEVASNSFRCLICATRNINKAIAANSYTISFRVFC